MNGALEAAAYSIKENCLHLYPPLSILPKMPVLRGGSWLTSEIFWSVVAIIGNLVAFILILGSEFFIDQLGSEEQKWLVTVLVSAPSIIPILLYCNSVWGSKIRKMSHNNLFLNVGLTYFCFLVLAMASHMCEYPKFHIKADEKVLNPKKIRNLFISGALATSSLAVSRAYKLQFEIGFFSFCIALAMELSLGILRENGRGRNWFYIVGTATFCFLLILIRKYLDSLQEKEGINANDQNRNEPSEASMVNDFISVEIGEAGLLQRRLTVKDRYSPNDGHDSNAGEPSHRRASSVNDEREDMEESWSVEEGQWESIPPRGDTETSSSSSAGDNEDTALRSPPQIENNSTPQVETSLDLSNNELNEVDDDAAAESQATAPNQSGKYGQQHQGMQHALSSSSSSSCDHSTDIISGVYDLGRRNCKEKLQEEGKTTAEVKDSPDSDDTLEAEIMERQGNETWDGSMTIAKPLGEAQGLINSSPCWGSPEYSPVPGPRMTSPVPSSRIHSGTVTPVHPRSGGTPTIPSTVTNPSPFSHSNSAATSASMPRSPGSPRWKKGKFLGSGTFGLLYVGFNSESGELCAIKEVTEFLDDAESKESAKQLMQEIALLRQLCHPNIVQYYGSETVNERLYIYQEYVSGGSIHKLLQEYGQFGEMVIRSYTQQILSGLAYLHAKNTVHRNIKGANILVDPNGLVKLADFGMAKHIPSVDLSLKGSPYWTAPEVIRNSNGCNLAVDIWSLGCTVLEMATTQPPWSQFEGVAAMFKIGNSKELPAIPDQLSDEGKDFIRKCLQRNPQDRPSASELLEHPFVKCTAPLERPILGHEASNLVPGIVNVVKSLGRNRSTLDSDKLSIDSSGVLITKAEPSPGIEDGDDDPVAWAGKELRMSDTFNDAASSRREKSMDHDEFNRRAEEFIKSQMRLQRRESEQRFMEMVNHGVYND